MLTICTWLSLISVKDQIYTFQIFMDLEIGLLILQLFKVLNLARHKDKYFLLANWPRLIVIAKTITTLIPLPITCLFLHRKVYAKKNHSTRDSSDMNFSQVNRFKRTFNCPLQDNTKRYFDFYLISHFPVQHMVPMKI